MDRYSRTKLLGKGSFANAWLVCDKQTQDKYVMKEMRTFTKEDLRDAVSESEILARLDHPNIIKCVTIVIMLMPWLSLSEVCRFVQ